MRSGGISISIGWPTASDAGVAEDDLGASIPGGDRPVQALADNGVIGGIDHGGQAFAHGLSASSPHVVAVNGLRRPGDDAAEKKHREQRG